MVKKGSELTVPVSAEAMEQLRQDFPTEQGFTRILLPRLGMASQDVTEEVRNEKTKKKEIRVVTEAGQFFIEKQTDEEDADTGKKQWSHDEIDEPEGIILFQRKQLRMYDESTELYTSSPIYDSEDEVLPLFCDKKEVARGTPKELKALYQFEKDGKTKSKLEDNRILYVLYEGTIYQMNLRGSSMYSYMTYARDLNKKGLVPPAVLTKFSSEAKSKGTIDWNQMIFTPVRGCTKAEIADVTEKMGEIKSGIQAEKGFYAGKDIQQAEGESDEDFAARKESLKKF